MHGQQNIKKITNGVLAPTIQSWYWFCVGAYTWYL